MSGPLHHPLDLVLERQIDLVPEDVWAAWTRPELLVRWFTPAPWRTLEAEIEPIAGGGFRTVMQGPEGPPVDGGAGCILLADPPRRLVWTNAMGPGFRPLPPGSADDFAFVADLSFEPRAGGTWYRAVVRHADVAGRDRHEAMGFEAGWAAALVQLVELMQETRA